MASSELPPLYEPPGKRTPLASAWAFWVQKKGKKFQTSGNWFEGTQCLGRFSSVEGFWHIYTHLVRADRIAGSVDVMLFRDGIRPVWEDTPNGGKWAVKLKKNGAQLLWEELVLAMVGEQFDAGAEICGAVLSVRFHDDNLALWLRNSDAEGGVRSVRDSLVRLLQLPPSLHPEYQRWGAKRATAPATGPGAGAGIVAGAGAVSGTGGGIGGGRGLNLHDSNHDFAGGGGGAGAEEGLRGGVPGGHAPTHLGHHGIGSSHGSGSHVGGSHGSGGHGSGGHGGSGSAHGVGSGGSGSGGWRTAGPASHSGPTVHPAGAHHEQPAQGLQHLSALPLPLASMTSLPLRIRPLGSGGGGGGGGSSGGSSGGGSGSGGGGSGNAGSSGGGVMSSLSQASSAALPTPADPPVSSRAPQAWVRQAPVQPAGQVMPMAAVQAQQALQAQALQAAQQAQAWAAAQAQQAAQQAQLREQQMHLQQQYAAQHAAAAQQQMLAQQQLAQAQQHLAQQHVPARGDADSWETVAIKKR